MTRTVFRGGLVFDGTGSDGVWLAGVRADV